MNAAIMFAVVTSSLAVSAQRPIELSVDVSDAPQRIYRVHSVLPVQGGTVRLAYKVLPHDWKGFFEERLQSTSPKAPLDGITEGGWRLVYTDAPNTAFESPGGGSLDCSSSLGMTVAEDGSILDVTPGMAAFEAGLGPGMRVVALNGRRFTTGLMTRAIKESRASTEPMQLVIENGDYFSTHAVSYRDGERQPHLERDESKPDLLSAILAPRVTSQ